MNIRLGKGRTGLGLSATLALAFITLSAVFLLISSGLQIYSNIQVQRQVISSRQQLIAQAAARTVSSFIQEKFGVLEVAARLIDPATMSRDALKQIINSLLGFQPAFRQLSLLDAQEQQIVWTSRLSQVASGKLTDKLTADAIKLLKQGKNYISPVYIDPDASEPMIVIAIPVTNVFKDVQGTLVAELNLKFMWDLMDQVKVGQAGYAYVVDEKGTLIAFNDTARVLRAENLVKISEVQRFLSHPAVEDVSTAETFLGINGKRVVGSYVPLGTPQWAVVTELPWQEAYQAIIQDLIWAIVITLGMVAIAGLVGAFVARRLAVPLVSLMETANRISNGEIELQAEVTGSKEVAGLASAFNSMTNQLRQTLGSLEQQVADRTRALQTSTEVSRRISTILDTNHLVNEVVDQLKLAFNYYHVHIYLFDEARENLIMAGGSGEPGRLMLARGHRLAKGRGLVGRAADTGSPVLVSDVHQAPDWLPNPLLPETRSEVAVPIAIGGNVLGVLDVQQDKVGELKQEDADLLQSIANQVAVALQNTRIYAQVQHQASREALISAIGQRIQHTSSTEEALKIAVREVGRALGMQRATVRLETKPENGDKSKQPNPVKKNNQGL